MGMATSYFRVLEPLRVWKVVGSSPSNTWIGSSRSINSVTEVSNARAGDEIHALPGGLFMGDASGAHEIRLRPPVPLLQARYHRFDQDAFLKSMVSAGVLEPMANPSARIDYVKARESAKRTFPEFHPEEILLEPSPEHEKLALLVSPFADTLREAGAEVTVAIHEVSFDRPPRAAVGTARGVIEILARGPGSYLVDMPLDLGPDASVDGCRVSGSRKYFSLAGDGAVAGVSAILDAARGELEPPAAGMAP